MNILETEEVMALSTFKCKVCCRGLRLPIFQIDAFGNICGNCYGSSVYTNAKRNVEIEMFLGKLYLSCDFASNGCTYKGPYNETCNHEKKCRFRSRKCPFSYQKDCQFEFINSENVIEHIRNNHEEDVFKVVDKCIELQNPPDFYQNLFYLLHTDDIFILLRTMLKPAKSRVYYVFYHFGTEAISLSLSFNGREVNLTTRHEAEICCKFDSDNAFKIALDDYELSVKVEFPIKSVETRSNGEDDDALCAWSEASVIKCSDCLAIAEETAKCCLMCNKTTCGKCNPKCECGVGYSRISVSTAQVQVKFRCENAGCQQMIIGAAYDVHCNYQCHFSIDKCWFCNWMGSFLNMVKHCLEKHSIVCPFVNRKRWLMRTKSHCFFFINGEDIICHHYVLNDQKELHVTAIKLTEPYWTNSYTWMIKIKSEVGNKNIAIGGDYTVAGYIRKVNVGPYIVNDICMLETNIRRN